MRSRTDRQTENRDGQTDSIPHTTLYSEHNNDGNLEPYPAKNPLLDACNGVNGGSSNGNDHVNQSCDDNGGSFAQKRSVRARREAHEPLRMWPSFVRWIFSRSVRSALVTALKNVLQDKYCVSLYVVQAMCTYVLVIVCTRQVVSVCTLAGRCVRVMRVHTQR